MGGNARSKEEKKILTALAVTGGSNFEPMPIRIGNQEFDIIAEQTISKTHGANKIRELYRGIFEIPGKSGEIDLRQKKEIETEWEFLEERKEVNSADKIDQLNALRYKTKMGIGTYKEKKRENLGKRNAWYGEINAERRNLQQIWRR